MNRLTSAEQLTDKEISLGPVILMRKGVQESKKEDDGDSVALMRYMSDNYEDLFLNVSSLLLRVASHDLFPFLESGTE